MMPYIQLYYVMHWAGNATALTPVKKYSMVQMLQKTKVEHAWYKGDDIRVLFLGKNLFICDKNTLWVQYRGSIIV